MSTQLERLRDILVHKATELFAAYGVPCTVLDHSPSEPSGAQLCSVLSFTSPTFRGSVIMVATPAALASSNPVPGGKPGAWAAELANQLVGRFKNDLYRYGVDVTMSIPVVLTATHVAPALDQPFRPIHFGVGAGQLVVWSEIDGEAELAEVASPDLVMGNEGDLVIL